MTEETIIRLAVLAIQAFPPIASAVLSVVRPDVAQTIREQLAGARATMAAAPSATPRVLTMVEEAKARTLAAQHPRISAHHADVLKRLLRPTAGALLSLEERQALTDLEQHARALADTDRPPVLAAPVGAWTEPSGSED